MAKNALTQLATLNEAVTRTKRDLAINEEGHAQTSRDLANAQSALDAHHADGPPDEATEDRLIAVVNRIRSRLHDPNEGKPSHVRSSLPLYDVAVKQRSNHLKKALSLQEERRDSFIADNKAALIGELVEVSRAERAVTEAAHRQVREAVASWQAATRQWMALSRQLEIQPSGDIPTSPLVAALQAADWEMGQRGAEHSAPCPWWALPDDELSESLQVAAIDRRNPDGARTRAEVERRALVSAAGFDD